MKLTYIYKTISLISAGTSVKSGSIKLILRHYVKCSCEYLTFKIAYFNSILVDTRILYQHNSLGMLTAISITCFMMT